VASKRERWRYNFGGGRCQTVVAVVGSGHLQGMQQKWDTEVSYEAYQELVRLPETRKRSGSTWTQVTSSPPFPCLLPHLHLYALAYEAP
jgi:pheromone shutdown protein TraB